MGYLFLPTSLPVRGAWVEIASLMNGASERGSLPVRGAWVEIKAKLPVCCDDAVAPRAGSVG